MDESNDVLQQVLAAISEISKDLQGKLLKINEREDKLEADLRTTKDTSEALINELKENVKNNLDSLGTGVEKNLVSNIANIQNSISEIKAGMKNDLAKQSALLLSNIQDNEKNFTQKYEDLLSQFGKNKNEFTGLIQTSISPIQTQVNQLKTTVDTSEKNIEEKIVKFNASMLEKINTETTQMDQRYSSIIKDFQGQFEDSNKNIHDLTTNTGSRFDNIHEKILGIQDDITKGFAKADTQLESSRKELNSLISSVNQELETKISNLTDNFTNKMQTSENNWSNKFTEANAQVTKLISIGENHSTTILNVTDLMKELRESYLKNFEELKNDQRNIMTSFQKIITGLGENIRNEVIILSKDVRNQLDNFAKESSTLFMLKSDGDRIDDRQKNLDIELRSKSETIRHELVQTLDDSLKNFEAAIKDSINSVNEVKFELEKYKDEIESMIERKVNEKYEFVFEILSSVLTRAETLTSLVREARIVSTSKVEIPIKELTSNSTIVHP